MAETESRNYDFKIRKKLITIVLVFVAIFPAIAMSAMGNGFDGGKFLDEPKLHSPNEWHLWKDERGEPFYINHGIREAQKENPKNMSKYDPVTKLPYPQTIDAKIKLFNAQIDKSEFINKREKKYVINVARSAILKDSYRAVTGCNAKKNLRKMLQLEFEDEQKCDFNESLAKEWFSLLSNEISDPKNGFFKYVDENNHESEMDPESKNKTNFRFIGRVVGAAVYHQIPVNISFVKPYYKIMLSQPVQLDDVKDADPTYHKYLLQADSTAVKEYVSSTQDSRTFNKAEMMYTLIRKKYVDSVKTQMSAFLEGFNELMPLHLLRIFTADELKQVIGGVQSIDTDDWKRNILYQGGNANSLVIRWFWQIVDEYTNEEKRWLLQFVVGTSRVPAGGFKNLQPQFKIIKTRIDLNDSIPKANICFSHNELYLSDYTDKESLDGLLKEAMEKIRKIQLF